MTIQLTIYIFKWQYNWLSTNDNTIEYIHSQLTIQLTMLLLLLLLLNSYIYKTTAAEFSIIYCYCCWILITIRLLLLLLLLVLLNSFINKASSTAAKFLHLYGSCCWIFNNLLLMLLLLLRYSYIYKDAAAEFSPIYCCCRCCCCWILYTIDYIYSQMPIPQTIYIVQWLYNWLWT